MPPKVCDDWSVYLTDLPLSRSGKHPAEIAEIAVRMAGQTIMDSLGSQMHIDYKGRGNITTEIDYRAENQIVSLLSKEFPDFSIMAEESSPGMLLSEYAWIVDPIDGSRNFASTLPMFCVNLALAHNDEPVVGVTYDPVRDELFKAVEGQSTTLNGTEVRVTAESTLHNSIIGFDMGYDNDMAKDLLEMATQLWPGMQSIRIVGSAALGLAYASCGRLDIYVHHLLSPWDMAPGLLLVRQAGGVVTDKNGGPVNVNGPSVIASNQAVHDDFLRLTEGCNWRK